MEWGSRLDYAHEAARQLRERLSPDHKPLGHYVESVVRNPPEDPLGIYSFATVDRNTGEVRMDRIETTKYEPKDLRVIHAGDIVVSGIDLVHGAVGYAQRDVADRVVSKEFYTLKIRREHQGSVDPRYIALLLRTPHASELIAGMVTGTSNRTRIEDVDALLSLPLPPMPQYEVQRKLADQIAAALERRRKARTSLGSTLKEANRTWGGDLGSLEGSAAETDDIVVGK